MEAAEAAELMETDEAEAESRREKRQRLRGALTVSVLAMSLAIASLGGSNAAKTSTSESIAASDTFNFFQAKNARQNMIKLRVDELKLDMARDPAMTAAARAATELQIAAYDAKIAELESEPSTGEGKKELLAKARGHEQARDLAFRQDPWFDAAEGALQIAIVLVSVSLVVSAPWLYWIGLALGLGGAAAAANGFFLWL